MLILGDHISHFLQEIAQALHTAILALYFDSMKLMFEILFASYFSDVAAIAINPIAKT